MLGQKTRAEVHSDETLFKAELLQKQNIQHTTTNMGMWHFLWCILIGLFP